MTITTKHNEPPNPLQNNPLNMFVLSINTLHQQPTDQTLPPNWSHTTSPNFQQTSQLECRHGIPPALRCAVYISSIITKATPNRSDSNEYGTLQKVRSLEYAWEAVISSLLEHSEPQSIALPDFGSNVTLETLLNDHEVTPDKSSRGVQALLKTLHVAKYHLGYDQCPLLTDVTTLLLTVMPEPYVYATLRSLEPIAALYFPISTTQHVAWCKTTMDIMTTRTPKTAQGLTSCQVLTPSGLDPIFRRLFVTILPREYVMRILDVYLVEGYKVLFRIGTALLCICHEVLKDDPIHTPEQWWEEVRKYTFSETFGPNGFRKLWTRSFGYHQDDGSSPRKNILQRLKSRGSNHRFPRRLQLRKLLETNESWATTYLTNHPMDNHTTKDLLPLGFVEHDVPLMLAKSASSRLTLAKFLPSQFQSTKLDLLYSSDVHGRSLEMIYAKCVIAKHTLLVLEVRHTDRIIGMFATDTWRDHPSGVYGDGGCFLFRLTPDPVCYTWNRDMSCSTELKDEALWGQFMISNKAFASIGGTRDGGSGLRINEDLSTGSSVRAIGFNNDPLAGDDTTEFEIGLVEVYQLLREVGGQSVDSMKMKVEARSGLWRDVVETCNKG